MDGVRTVDPLISRALKRAIAYCNTMIDAEESERRPGAAASPAILAWRREAAEFRRLLEKLQPRQKGAA